MSSEEGYNGWTNYETWNVNLWLGDDEYYRELAMQAVDLHDAAITLKDYTSDIAEELVPGVVDGASFVVDLFNGALSEVNWQEIAERYRDELVEA